MHRLESEGGGQTNPNNLDKQYKIKATSQNYENPNPSEGGTYFLPFNSIFYMLQKQVGEHSILIYFFICKLYCCNRPRDNPLPSLDPLIF